MKLRRFRRGQATDQVIKWIIYIAIVIAVGIGVRGIVLKFSG